MTDPSATNGNGLSGADMLALIAHMSNLLGEMEGRIMARLTENSQGAADRWRKHDEELERNTKRVVQRFEVIEADLLTVSNCLKAHLDKEHDEEVATQARVRPVKTLAQWLAVNWKSVLLAILALAGIFGWVGLETHIAGQ